MSSTEKTKQKLMETMRMTKAETNKKKQSVATKQTTKPQSAKTVVKKKKTTARKKVTKDTKTLSIDPYQSVTRVWPD